MTFRRLLCVRDRRGVVALELALVASGFIGMIVFAVYLSFRLYAQEALDYATSRAARLLAVDATQALSKTGPTFQSATFCPLLAGLLSCGNVVLSLQPVTDFLAATSPVVANGKVVTTGLPFSPGQGSNLMLLRATYVLPVGWPWTASQIVGFGATHGVAVTSTFPYQNEY